MHRLAVACVTLGLTTAAACGDDAPACEPGWQVEHDATGGALLAAFGDDADAGWLVGGELGNGAPAARVLRWRGDEITPVEVPGDDTVWWGWSDGAGGVWLVGERGLVLRGGDDGFTPLATGVDATLYGVWGAAPDDVWLVGGMPDGEATDDDDLVLRWDGAALTRVALPARGATLFKVWGSAADDVWIVGEGGTAWRWDGAAWEDHAGELGASTRLTTVHGCARDEVYAVGGPGVWRWDGAAWALEPGVAEQSLTAGVACGADHVLVVGFGGLKLRKDRATGAWTDEQAAAPLTDFHGAWAAPDGALWAVGGGFLSPPGGTSRRGVAARWCP